MKKILLTLFCCLMAFVNIQAEEKTYTYEFKSAYWSTSTGGDIPTGNDNKLSDFYYRNSGEKFNTNNTGYFSTNYFLWGKSGAYIELPTFAGEEITEIIATASTNCSEKVKIGVFDKDSIKVVNEILWAKNDTIYSYEIPEFHRTSTLRLQITNANNAQITQLIIKTKTIENTNTPGQEVFQGGVDVLTIESIGVKSYSSYTSWSEVQLNTSVIYAGHSHKNNTAIQLRSSDNLSGIITTKSGVNAEKIVVEWASNTTNGRILNIYGKNTPYESTADLYDTNKQGKLLGQIKKGQATELQIDGDYEYIGIRSSSAAMYVESIEITWVAKKVSVHSLNVTAAGWATLYLGYNAIIPTGVEAYAISEVQNDWAKLSPVEGIIPANEGVIIKANAGAYDFIQTTEIASIEANLLKGTLTDKDIQGEAYVLGLVDGEVGLYKALMNGTAWKNNANKAYLPMPADSQNISFYSFRGDDEENTTAIENVETATVNVIYDLSGRRVETITAPGIYVVNGRKMLVK